ncbi:hypothetical protein TNCV_4379641 [Trichonephila clavipes]|nr:hypothetical protein TNCV_4379641 [Trichonephila clavipes]
MIPSIIAPTNRSKKCESTPAVHTRFAELTCCRCINQRGYPGTASLGSQLGRTTNARAWPWRSVPVL